MRRLSPVALALLGACAGTGGASSEPLAWPPGEYYLEATVSYDGGAGTRNDLFSADLYVEADQSIRLDAHEGVCRPPAPPELEADFQRRVRTFRCGDVVFELRPGRGTVTGEIQAVVQEGYTITECTRRSATGACTQTSTRVATRPARKQARLRVRERS